MPISVTAEPRTKLGRAVKELRRNGLIPAELYGYKVDNIHLSVPKKAFLAVYKEAGESTMIDLVVGSDTHKVMIHDIARHPLTDEIITIDFYKVNLKEEVTVNVPLTYTGESPAVKNAGGVLVKNMNDIEISALPTALPHDIEVDLGLLAEIGDTIRVKDLKIPEGASTSLDPEGAVASVSEKLSEEEDLAESEEVDISSIVGEDEPTEEAPSEEAEAEE